MGYGYDYTMNSVSNSIQGAFVWTIISVVVAIVGGFALYFTFLAKKNDGKQKGFLGFLYDFLTFKKLFIEDVLKVTYLILAIFVTLSSFNLIAVNFVSFLATLIGGNVVLRIGYELSLLFIQICQNVKDINKKLNK